MNWSRREWLGACGATAGAVATGNTNIREFFEPDVKTFLKRWVAQGPTHHFALGIGNSAGTIQKIGELLNLETAVISKERA